jgi:ubiquitin-protein ligase
MLRISLIVAERQAMIIGPEGTPYENGCFVFDIFLPIDYNKSSPMVKSMTTNGGRYRYNPNLYADGVRFSKARQIGTDIKCRQSA